MTDAPNLMDAYLSEIRARSKSASAEEMFQRLAAEKKIQEILLHLSGEFGFRFIEDRRVNPDQPSSDYVLQFDNYEARLEIKYEASAQPTLSNDDIERFAALLEKNDLSDAIIIVWTTDDLMAATLTLPLVRYLQETPAAISNIIDSTRPLEETITRFIESQTPRWSVPSEVTPKEQLLDTSSIFVKELEYAIQDETKRKFLIPEKQIAARMLGQNEIRQFENLLQKAVGGADITYLKSQLLSIFRIKE